MGSKTMQRSPAFPPVFTSYKLLEIERPAYTVGSLRANVQVECLVAVIDDLVSSDDPQEKLKRFTNALHEVFAFGSSKTHMSQRQLGRLEPPLLPCSIERMRSCALCL